jgi:Mn-dependent DtxR family transcriptional regulator
MRKLTDEHHFMLEVIADRPMPAIPEVSRYVASLAEARLIEVTPERTWRITELGKAVLERRGCWLH